MKIPEDVTHKCVTDDGRILFYWRGDFPRTGDRLRSINIVMPDGREAVSGEPIPRDWPVIRTSMLRKITEEDRK